MPERVQDQPTQGQPENNLQASPLEVRLSPGFNVRLGGVPVLGWRSRADEVLAFLILTTERDPILIGAVADTLNVHESRVRHALRDLRQKVGEARIHYENRRIRFLRGPADTVDLWDYASLAQQDAEPELLEQAVSFWTVGVLQYEAAALANVDEQKRPTSDWAWLSTARVGKSSLLDPYRRTFERADARLAELRQPPPPAPTVPAELPIAPSPGIPEDSERPVSGEHSLIPCPGESGRREVEELHAERELLYGEASVPRTEKLPLASVRRPLRVRRARRIAALLGIVAGLAGLIFLGINRPAYTPGERDGQPPDTRYIEARARVARYLKLGAPVEPVQEYPDGSIQRFRGGENGPGLFGAAHTSRMVFWIDGEIYKKYLQPLGQFETEPLRNRLGYPKSDIEYQPNPTFHHTGICALFDRGLIAHHTNGRLQGKTYAIEGAIYQVFSTYGLGSAALGYPVSDEEDNASGAREGRFEGGIITTINGGKSYQVFPNPQPQKMAE